MRESCPLTCPDREEEDRRLLIIEQKLDKLSTDVADLILAWKAASWLVSFVKWLGAIATAITAIILLFKGVK